MEEKWFGSKKNVRLPFRETRKFQQDISAGVSATKAQQTDLATTTPLARLLFAEEMLSRPRDFLYTKVTLSKLHSCISATSIDGFVSSHKQTVINSIGAWSANNRHRLSSKVKKTSQKIDFIDETLRSR